MAHITCHHPKQRADEIVIPFEELNPDDFKSKWCAQCRHWKPLDAFYSNRSRYDGRASECKDCDNKNRRNRDRKRVR